MDVDFAIVGGGIVGSSIAYHLSGRGDAEVAVFEREPELATETTAKSNAVFRMTGSAAEREMKRYGLSLYNDFLADPALEHDVDPLYERLDRLEVATSPSGAAGLRDRAEAGPGEYLDPDDLDEHVMFPELRTDEMEAALLFPDSIRLEPRALAMEFAERARANGVRFETGTPVRDVTTTDGRVTGIETDAGTVAADVVISAAGPKNVDVAGMAGVDLPQRHTLGPILDVRPRRGLGHTLPNLKHADSGVYYTGRADGTVMIGRSGGPYGNAERRDLDSLDEDRVADEVRADMAAASEQLVPALAMDEIEIHDEWVGLVSKTPDGEPIIGRTECEGFAVASFNSEAIQLAPAAGRITAEQLIDGRPASDYPHVSPTRFGAQADPAQH